MPRAKCERRLFLYLEGAGSLFWGNGEREKIARWGHGEVSLRRNVDLKMGQRCGARGTARHGVNRTSPGRMWHNFATPQWTFWATAPPHAPPKKFRGNAASPARPRCISMPSGPKAARRAGAHRRFPTPFCSNRPRVTTALRGYAAAIFRRAAPPARRVCLVAPKFHPTIFRLTSPKPLCPLRGKGVYGSLAIALTG